MLNLATSVTFGAHSVRNGTTCVDDSLREAAYYRARVAEMRRRLAPLAGVPQFYRRDLEQLLDRARREHAQAILDARIHRYRREGMLP